MSEDTNEKVQSKFPRSSLRARNKTMMIQPADVADFQVEDKDDGFSALDVDDLFEDDFDQKVAKDAAGQETEMDLGPSEFLAESILNDEPLAGLETEASLGEDSIARLDGDVKVENVAVHSSIFEPSVSGKKDDIFAAPLARGDEEVERPARALDVTPPDPITRGTRRERGDEARIEWKKPTKLVGFLVSFTSDSLGSYVELREGRLLVSSERSLSDSCLVIHHESVSPMHAIMRISGDGDVLILDQLSEHGTRIKRAEDQREDSLMGDKSALRHGDVVIFGECEYHVALLGAAALRR